MTPPSPSSGYVRVLTPSRRLRTSCSVIGAMEAPARASVFEPVAPQSTYEETVARLGTAIRLGVLAPGAGHAHRDRSPDGGPRPRRRHLRRVGASAGVRRLGPRRALAAAARLAR